jgi:hypothetical protein
MVPFIQKHNLKNYIRPHLSHWYEKEWPVHCEHLSIATTLFGFVHASNTLYFLIRFVCSTFTYLHICGYIQPIAYISKALIYRYSFKEAFRRYKEDIQEHGLLTKYFSLWFPVQCLTFSVVPEHFRVTFIACVSFFWLIILSSIASKSREEDECSLVDGVTCNIDG